MIGCLVRGPSDFFSALTCFHNYGPGFYTPAPYELNPYVPRPAKAQQEDCNSQNKAEQDRVNALNKAEEDRAKASGFLMTR